VIKNRLATGEIDPTGEHLRPNGNERTDDHSAEHSRPAASEDAMPPDTTTEVPSTSIRSHPAARHQGSPDESAGTHVPGASAGDPTASAQLLPSVLLDRSELCGMTGMTDSELTQLEGFGILAANDSTGTALYGGDAVEIAKTACEFLRSGVDARHLRNWRTSAEREASLYEQLVMPRFRQRNPEARAAALDELERLDQLGAKLRAAMTRQALRHHFES
jgi:hypothetical protein